MKPQGKPVVFLGPTLRRPVAARLCDADFRPPAAMGDITLAACERPEAIILIDGVFESKPSVWHKEIMWAIDLGIPVIGASSMGALRAAELQDFGMAGYGGVFAAFAAGQLQDDDEVAVLHGPEELDWQAMTDAMVDIRYWAGQAAAEGVISNQEQAAIIASAKSVHFKARSFEGAIRSALQGQPGLARIAGELRQIGPGLKECDCQNLLRSLSDQIALSRQGIAAAPKFVPTAYLRRLRDFGFEADTNSKMGERQ